MNLRVNRTTESMRTWLIPIAAGLLLPVASVSFASCKKDEPPPPLPSAAPEPAPSPPLALEIEDAGAPPEDVAPDVKKKYTGGSSASMKKCCQAVAQNAENAPEPTKTYMKQMAAACFAAAGAGRAWSGGGFACK